MGDQLRVAWVINRFHPQYELHQLGIVMLDVLDQERLGICRSRDENRPRIRNRFGNRMKKLIAEGIMPAADGVRLVVNMPGRMIGTQYELVGFRRTEMEYPRLVMIDPDNGMVVWGGHELGSPWSRGNLNARG